MARDRSRDGENEEGGDEPQSGCGAGCFLLFTSGTVIANGALLLILGVLLGAASWATHQFYPAVEISGLAVHLLLRCCAVVAGCLSAGLLGVAGFLAVSLQRRWFYNWNGLFYMTEVKGWIGLLMGALLLLPLVYTECARTRVFGAVDLAKVRVVLVVSMVVAVAMAVKGHLMQRVAMSFNYANYRDRIQEALFAERMIQQLLAARHTYRVRMRGVRTEASAFGFTLPAGLGRPPTISRSERLEAPATHDDDASSTAVPEPEPEPGAEPGESAALPHKKVPVTEQDKQQQFDAFFILANRTMAHFDAVPDPKAEISREAEKTAGRIMRYLRPANRDFLLPADFAPFLEDGEEREGLLALFKRRADAVAINERDVALMVEDTLSTRYGLAQSMKSIGAALDKINTLFTLTILLVMAVLVTLTAIPTAENIITTATTLIGAVAFVFGTSARNMFESVIFLLVIHPFDVGDRVYIVLGTGSPDAVDNLLVIDMHLLSTVFERWDGVRIYVPNYVLATKAITNIRRSGPLVERQHLHVAMSTSVPILHELRRRLQDWLARQSTDFDPDYLRVNLESIEENARLTLAIQIRHVDNWQDWERQMARRSKIVGQLKGLLEDLGITYLPPVQRVALVNGPAAAKAIAETQ